MSVVRLFLLARGMLGLVIFALLAVGLVIYQLREIVINHAAFKKEYGDQWQAKYEERYGPVSEERVKWLVGIGGLATMGGTVYLIARKIGDPTGNPTRSGRRRRRR